ncbi:MAG: hypothetical protein ABIS21_03060 [Acidimicrobiales bacterium]
MVLVVRLAPLPLGHRRDARLAELERVFGTEVHLIEVANIDELTSAIAASEVDAVAIDAPAPGQLGLAVAAAAEVPVLRPLWRPRRNNRGEMNEVFDGYGLLTDRGVAKLADGELAVGR